MSPLTKPFDQLAFLIADDEEEERKNSGVPAS